MEVNLRKAEAGADELKRTMKKTIDSEFTVTQKLTYEKLTRRDLEASLEVALKSLQNDQVAITRQEVELTNLKNATHYAMDMIASHVEGEEPKSALDRRIAILEKLLDY
jgi:macrodomain Ter protein organizer (MatP/YcbG family)